DGLGRTIKTESVDGAAGNIFVDTSYDNMGRVSSVTNPYRNGDPVHSTSTGYDALGRITNVGLPGGSSIGTTYGLATSGSVLGTAETTIDEAGRTKRTIEDALDNLVRVDEPNLTGSLGTENSPVQPTSYSYDARGNLTAISQGGQSRSFGYDAMNRLTSASNPESGTFLFSYDANGNLETKTDARGIVTTFSYDRLNRVKLKDYTGSTPDVTYFYDGAGILNSKGRLTRVVTTTSETNYTSYGPDGRVKASYQSTDGIFAPFAYQYNLEGNLISQSYPSGKVVSSTYGPTGDLTEVSRPLGGGTYKYASNFGYTAADDLEKIKLGNGLWERTEFNPRRQIKKIILGFTENDAGVWQGEFEYGTLQGGNVNAQLNNGSIARQTIAVPTIGAVPGFTAVQNYEYDTLDRLKSATETIGGQTWKQTFIPDRFGNKTYDPANTTTLGSCPTLVCNPTASQSDNKLGGYGYDNAGNITTDAEGRTFTYDAENRQMTASGSGLSMSYGYDGNGKRVKSHNALTNQTTYFVYDADGKLAAEYTVNVPPPASPTISYLTEDALGSPRVVTDSNGAVKARRDFYPYGEEIGVGVGSRSTAQGYSAGGDDIRKKFATYQRDIETGLDFAQSRYYQPKHGRFTSPDEFKGGPDELFDFEEDASDNPTFYADLSNPQSLNKYQYGYNNPYKFNDPNGHIPVLVLAAIVIIRAAPVIVAGVAAASRAAPAVSRAAPVVARTAPRVVPVVKRTTPRVANVVRQLNPARNTPRLRQDLQVRARPPSARTNSRIGNSRAQNRELKNDIKRARSQGATDIRVNQQQVNAEGKRVGINRPDLQYTRKDGTRAYTEYDRPGKGVNSLRGRAHADRILSNDPQGVVVTKQIQ
ncbi:MAG: RHS repeat domain-containing protein, partial [Pyrinomonadaceae bacterium]